MTRTCRTRDAASRKRSRWAALHTMTSSGGCAMPLSPQFMEQAPAARATTRQAVTMTAAACACAAALTLPPCAPATPCAPAKMTWTCCCMVRLQHLGCIC